MFFVSGHFYEGGGDYLDEGREISSPPGESISNHPEIESLGGGNISAGGRLYKGAISFRVTGVIFELVMV